MEILLPVNDQPVNFQRVDVSGAIDVYVKQDSAHATCKSGNG